MRAYISIENNPNTGTYVVVVTRDGISYTIMTGASYADASYAATQLWNMLEAGGDEVVVSW